MEKYTWEEAKEYLREYNKKNGFKCGNLPTKICRMVAVMKNKGFNRDDYTDEERSYVFSNNNKAFLDGMLGYSIHASCLLGEDYPRLDYLVEENKTWEVDYCYLLSED